MVKSEEAFREAKGYGDSNLGSLGLTLFIGFLFQILFKASMQYIWTTLAML